MRYHPPMPKPRKISCRTLASLWRVLFFLPAIASAVLAGLAAPAEPSAPHLQVGVAQIDITPLHPVRLSGFGFRRTESEGVTQPIWAKALAIAGPSEELTLLVTVDNVGVPAALTEELAERLQRKLGLAPARLTVTASHTHTAPMLSGALATLFGLAIPAEHQTNIDRYTRFFVDRLEETAITAARDLRPARLEWGIGRTLLAANRRTPGGPVDHDLPVLVVRDPKGGVRAIWFSYACHCVTLSHNKVSGDWAGYAQTAIQELFPNAIALASIGCGADANPTSGVTGDKVEIAEAQGRQIAQEVKRLLSAPLEAIQSPPQTTLERFDLALAPARPRSEWEERAKKDDAIGYHARVSLARLDRGESLPDRVPYSVQSWTFGDQLALVFLPGEVVVDYSLRLKREFDATRLGVIAYANAAPCYIPSERILREGGYEGGGAMIYYDQPQIFAPGLEEKIIGSVRRQIPATFASPPGTEGIAPRSPARGLSSYRFNPKYDLQLVASEPLLASPITIDWDAEGRLWVTEMLDYPAGLDGNWLPGGRIKILEDTDRDGRPDRATIFTDRIPFPTGVTVWGRGALICAAPDILYAEDTDGDLQADRIEEVFSGFATENFQARVNSLTLGLDNWIHGANGLLGGTIRGTFAPAALGSAPAARPQVDVDIRNRDFRFDPFTGAFEPAAGLTQHGRVRDDWGNWFGCDNSQALTQFPLPEHYLRRNPHVAAPDPIRLVPADPDPGRLFPASRLQARFNDLDMANRVTSACGIEIYRDELLADLRGHAFTCENVHNLVTRQVLSTDGILFTGHRAPEEQDSEFLASTDNWARPVQVRTGPDGALYLVDMYRFLIEHPRWIPAERLAQIDVRAGADRGRIYRLVPRDQALRPVPNLKMLGAASLVDQLDTPNGTERDRVHLELLRRGDPAAAAPLTRLARLASRPEVRLQALCVLDGLRALAPAEVRRALHDAHEQVRRHAVRLAERWLRDDRPKTDYQTTNQILDDLLALAADPSLAVRYQLAFSLGESADPRAGEALARLALTTPEHPYLRAAIVSSAVAQAPAILAGLAQANRTSAGLDALMVQLVATAAASGNERTLARTLDSLLPSANRPVTPARMAAFASLLDAAERRRLDLPAILAVDAAPPDGKARIAQLMAEARRLALNPAAPADERELALRTLGRDVSSQADDVELLAGLLTTSPELRSAALAVLQRLRAPAVAERLLRDWPQLSPVTRSVIVTLLLSREEWMMPLLRAVEGGRVDAPDVPLSDQPRLLRHPKEEVRTLAARLFQATPAGARAPGVDSLRSALALKGDPEQGREVFAKQCASCHALDGLGFNVGPDLLTLGGKDPDYWLKNILDPNAVIVPQFVAYNIETKDDRTLSGVIQGETSTSLTLVQGGGVVETILRSDIAALQASSLSLMPEGFEVGIPAQALADLLAFARRPATPKVVPGNQPAVLSADDTGSLTLPAAKATIQGGDITLESEFQNIGLWHGQNDQVSWTLTVRRAGDYDVHLDYACHNDAAGNAFRLSVAKAEIKTTVAGTGGWDQYRQVKLGRVALPAGEHQLVVRPDGPLRQALMDLRTLKLTPAGIAPRWVLPAPTKPAALPPGFTADHVARTPAAVASVILDPARPRTERETIIAANPQYCAEIIRELARDLAPGESEYERIPWIWRVAIATGRRNDPIHLRKVLNVSLPEAGEPLRDWQAVVVGGGLINGLSERGLPPGARLLESMGEDQGLRQRWERALDLASAMADDAKVPTGTRYDALRMLGVEPWSKRGAQLVRYLPAGTHEELQMGAVSGLADVEAAEAAAALLNALPGLAEPNRKLALDALIRRELHALALLEALAAGRIKPDELGPKRVNRLLQHEAVTVRQRSAGLLQR